MICKRLNKLIATVLIGTTMVISPITPINCMVNNKIINVNFLGNTIAEASSVISLDNAIRTLMGFGTPGFVLYMVAVWSGYKGAAALAFALATLGGPLGMIGGIIVLGALGAVVYFTATHGEIYMVNKYVEALKEKGKTKDEVVYEIESIPNFVVNEGVKAEVIYNLNKVEWN